MAFNGINEFISALENEGELVRIKTFVDPVLEITEVVDRESKKPGGGKALLFENTGTNFPLLINAFGSDKRIAMALGVADIDEISAEIENLFREISTPRVSLIDKLRFLPELKRFSSWMPSNSNRKGACQQNIIHAPDLSKLPVMQCWPHDGGPFITLPMVITKHPETNMRNIGMYRMQVFNNNTTGMHWHRHKTGANHYQAWKETGKNMPIAVALGGDPAHIYAATAPLPENIDEFILAGFLRKKKVALVPAITQDLMVPADADFIIEGYVDPEEEMVTEGPFGDHTGFYSLPDLYPNFHVTCITHRDNAVYPATIVGIPPQEDAYIGKATEKIFLNPIKFSMAPEILDMHLPFEGVAHNLTLIRLKKSYPGQAEKIMNTLWGAGQMMFNKIMVVVDEDHDVKNYGVLAREILEYFNPDTDLSFSGGPADVLDHATPATGYGSKAGINATHPAPEEFRNNNIFPLREKELFAAVEKFMDSHKEVSAVNADLIKNGYRILPLAIDKEKFKSGELRNALSENEHFFGLKIIIALDSEVPLSNISTLAWLTLANIDPKRDFQIWKNDNSEASLLYVDATSKAKEIEKFGRYWPNILLSNPETIKEIDAKWEHFNLGPFTPSPSLTYLPLGKGNSAFRKG